MTADFAKLESGRLTPGSFPRANFSGSVFLFFLATYILTWACWIGVLKAHIPLQSWTGELFILIGTFAPAFMALWFTWKYEGPAGIGELLGRMLKWRVEKRWYALAVAYMVAVKLTAALIHRLITGAWPRFGAETWYIVAVAIVFSTPVQAGEELGWRGYALPRLAERLGLPWASVVLGVIWATWHLPIFFIPGADKYGQSFPVWAAAVTAVSVAMAYVYAKTHGSLLLTMLMHAASNNTSNVVPAAQAGAANPFALHATPILWLTTALMWVLAAYFLPQMRKLTAIGSTRALSR